MILKNDSLAVAKMLGDLLTLFSIKNNTSKLGIHSMVFIESERVLCNHVQLAAKGRKRLSVCRMRVTSSINVWSCFVDFGMDRERSRIDRLITDDNVPIFVDKDEI